MRDDNLRDDLLVQYLNTRSEQDFARLWMQMVKGVSYAASQKLRDKDLVEDVTQEVFAKVLNGIDEENALRLGVRYLFSMARSVAQTKLRGEIRRAERHEHERLRRGCRGLETKDGNRFVLEDFWALRDAVDELPDHLRPYVEQRFFEVKKMKEIAQAAGKTERTIELKLKSAYAVLKVRLASSSAALLLPLLFGDLDGALPTLERRGAFRRNRTRERASYPSLLISVAASLLLMALILFLGALSPGGRGGVGGGTVGAKSPQAPRGDEPRAPPPLVADNFDRKEPLVDSSGAASKEAEANLLPPKEPSTPQEPPKEAEEPAPKEKASAVIRALDQNGKLLRQGMLVMRLAGEADPDDEMISVVTSLEMERDPLHLPRALAQENPVVLEGIPDILNGQEIEARVTGAFTWGSPRRSWFRRGSEARSRWSPRSMKTKR